ncbi:MAG: ribosome recycling factor [Actinobacteria bacterium]|jgi:ribosome recycling factor|nr:ribosome recycling factor [Actinomycetota bacterium]
MIDDTLLDAEEKMTKALEVAREEFTTIRAGRASAQVFSKIMVDYYGSPTPIQQVASIQTPEARLAVVTPFDKSALGAVERAIRDSDLGVNPSNDGNVIRVPFPQLTEDRRKEYVKVAKTKAEDSRITLRNIRRSAKEALEKLAKDGEVGKDDVARAEKALEELTGKFVTSIDDLLKHKEAELLEV